MRILFIFFLFITTVGNAQIDFKVVKENKDTMWVRLLGKEVTRSYTFTQWTADTVTLKYAPPVVVPPGSRSNLWKEITFSETNPLNLFTSLETFGTKPSVVNDPTNSSNKVLKVLVTNSSKDGDRIRNELTLWNLTEGLRQHATYGLSVYIPTTFKTDNNVMNFIQFHNAGKPGMIPNISFGLKGKELDLNIAWMVNATASTHSDLHKFFDVSDWFGKWVNIVMDINWFPDMNGYFKLYKDGVLLYEYKGPMGYNGDAQGAYMKVGLHFPGGVLPAGSTATSQTVYYDNIRIGNKNSTIKDVQP